LPEPGVDRYVAFDIAGCRMLSTDSLALAALMFVAAILYSSVGHAGASGYLAAMALAGMTPDAMKPTALALNVVVATVASIRYIRAGHFDWRTFYPFAILSIPAAFIGGMLHLPANVYRPAVGVVLLIAAAQLVRSARMAAQTETVRTRPVAIAPALATGAAIGLVAGLTGTGGGIFLSPVLLFTRWARTRLTSGISAAFILVNSIAGLAGTTITLQALPAALPLWAVLVLAGGFIGTQLGTRWLPVPVLRYVLAVVLVIAGSKLILS
jgi:uncharacterized protein